MAVTTRPSTIKRRGLVSASALAAVLLIAVGCWLEVTPAQAQFLGAPARRGGYGSSSAVQLQRSRNDPSAQMLVTADEIQYDYTNERVSAVSRVQIHYAGSTLEADKVIYDQKAKRLYAEGNIRLTDADGKIFYANMLNLSDDFRDGFVDSLRLDSPDKTRIAAVSAERTNNNITVFQNGVYTACEPCAEDPRKPPLWQVKAARIIHDQTEKMVYYEDARIEFFGVPLAYVPFFSAPDPTVKRKTGFLMPSFTYNSVYGVGVTTPFYWALAPNYDLTITPTITSNQGPLLQVEWRHRLMDGAYSIRAAGIWQLDKDQFINELPHDTFNSGFRDFRGMVQSSGQFNLGDQWVWGWDGTVVTDKPFLQDYSVMKIPPEIVSQAYLAGRGERSYFDARAVHYLGLSAFDSQSQLPVIHPVIDYFNTVKQPVFGGELGYRFNVTSLSRSNADFNPITLAAFNMNVCTPTTPDPAAKIPANCLLRGIPGDFTRGSADMLWRRTIVDSWGQMFTPFVSARVDAAALSVTPEPGVANYIATGDSTVVRGMPAAGVEYRYPFISVHSWGTQTIEPIAQVIVRPNETAIGRFPNEDAQSLIFSDANLLSIDKFSGYDRVEGGTRANVAVQYTAQFNRGGYVNALVGQSYQLFGKNSFAAPDITNTGLDSGLETRASDYVARLTFQPTSTYGVITRFRLDEKSLDVRTAEFESRVNFERWSVSLIYGNYDAQPDIGILTRRQAALTTGSVKLTQNWSLSGGFRYDFETEKVNQTIFGLGYIDDCFAVRVTYITSYGYTVTPQPIHSVLLQISLRTLGTTHFTQRVDNLTGITDQTAPFSSLHF
ncbi:MAG: LPS-assembly protein LptD [Xanthobacteraceae bacterium]